MGKGSDESDYYGNCRKETDYHDKKGEQNILHHNEKGHILKPLGDPDKALHKYVSNTLS